MVTADKKPLSLSSPSTVATPVPAPANQEQLVAAIVNNDNDGRPLKLLELSFLMMAAAPASASSAVVLATPAAAAASSSSKF